jgi:hypothetical protein
MAIKFFFSKPDLTISIGRRDRRFVCTIILE